MKWECVTKSVVAYTLVRLGGGCGNASVNTCVAFETILLAFLYPNISTLPPIHLMTSWSAVSNAAAVITPAERSKRWGLFSSSEHSSQMALTSTLVSFKHLHCFYLMRTHVTHTLGHTFPFHSCVSRAHTLHASALSPLVSSYGVCQLATMGFFTLMKGSAQNICTFFNVQWHLKSFPLPR